LTVKRLLLASMLLLAIACCLPTLTLLGSKGDTPKWPGFAVMGLGWMAAIYGQFAWFANVFWVLGGVLTLWNKSRWAKIMTALSVLLAANCVTLRSLRIPEDESGSAARASIQSLGPGFYFWIASLLVMLIASHWKKGADTPAS